MNTINFQKKIIYYFLLVVPLYMNAMEFYKPITTITSSYRSPHNFNHNDLRYINAQTRAKIYSNNDFLLSKKEYTQLQESYSISSLALAIAAKINNKSEVSCFLNTYNNHAFELMINRNTVDKLIPVLYTSNGYPKLQLNSYEKYQVARIVTDYYKVVAPNEYLKFIEYYAAQGYKEFTQILKEETTYGSWLKYKFCGLMQGVFIGSSFNGNVHQFGDLVEKNDFINTYGVIAQLTNNHDFVQAKTILNEFLKIDNNYLVPYQKAAENLYNARLEAECESFLKKHNITPSPRITSFVKQIIESPKTFETAALLYRELANNPYDDQFGKTLNAFLDKNGIPIFCTYDGSLVGNTKMPHSITAENLNEHLSILKLVLSTSRSPESRLRIATGLQYLAHACSNENPLAKSYAVLGHAMANAMESAGDKTILSCTNFSSFNETTEISTMHRRVVPLAANLVNEIERLNTSDINQANKLKSELVTLSKLFYEENQSASNQHTPLPDTIDRLNGELQTFSRPEMHRSPSMEKIFLARTAEFLVSTNIGSFNLDELNKFSGSAEQNAVHADMMHHIKVMSIKAAGIEDVKNSEAFKIHNKLIEATYQLNKDSKTTLASGVLAVAKDFAEILVTDFPLTEICDYAHETITHPIDYIARTGEGFVTGVCGLAQLIIHEVESLSLITSPIQRDYAESQRLNTLLHNFFDGWASLNTQEKKEFIAQLFVNVGLNKAFGKLISCLNNSTYLGDLTAPLTIVEDSVGGISGGAISLSPAVALVHEGATALAPVTAIPIGAIVEGVADIGSIIHLASNVNGDGNGDDGNMPSSFLSCDYQYGKITPKIPIDSLTPNDSDILFTVEPFHESIIKEFNITRKMFDHVFSGAHVKNGLLMGCTKEYINECCIHNILKADKLHGLQELGNHIVTQIDGWTVTLRIHIINGKVMSINGFIGESERIIGKYIDLRL